MILVTVVSTTGATTWTFFSVEGEANTIDVSSPHESKDQRRATGQNRQVVEFQQKEDLLLYLTEDFSKLL